MPRALQLVQWAPVGFLIWLTMVQLWAHFWALRGAPSQEEGGCVLLCLVRIDLMLIFGFWVVGTWHSSAFMKEA